MRFTFTLLIILVCILYTPNKAIGSTADYKKPEINLDKTFEETCTKTCIKDYTKVADCDTNEMLSEYIIETNEEN